MKNEQDIVAGNKGGLETKFETKYHSFSSCVFLFCSFAFEVQRTFIALCFALPMT
jgi:hypothetical protein